MYHNVKEGGVPQFFVIAAYFKVPRQQEASS